MSAGLATQKQTIAELRKTASNTLQASEFSALREMSMLAAKQVKATAIIRDHFLSEVVRRKTWWASELVRVAASANVPKLATTLSASAIALTAINVHPVSALIDPERVRSRLKQLSFAEDRINALARRDPKSAEIFREMPFDDAYRLLRYFPIPAHRPKGLNPETEDQLRRMAELMESEEARNPTEAAKLAAGDHRTTADLKSRADYLVKLWKRGRSGEK